MPAGERRQLIASICKTISDYREGELERPSPEHVEQWVRQFGRAAQNPILAEIDHVLKRTYINKCEAEKFLGFLLDHKHFRVKEPAKFWRTVSFLRIQRHGNSQRELLELLDPLLEQKFRFDTSDCDGSSNVFFYIDDFLFGGGHVKGDVGAWIRNDAPPKCDLHIVVMGFHLLGNFFVKGDLEKAISESGKKINVTWWSIQEIEDRLKYIDVADVLRPTRLPDDEETRAYVESLIEQGARPIAFRKPGSVGRSKFYSSEAGRDVLEQEFLKAGVQIREMCPYLNQYQRPLGNMLMKTLGFGAMSVTYRNCANNCPLALWAGDPWYPLFERKTNRDE